MHFSSLVRLFPVLKRAQTLPDEHVSKRFNFLPDVLHEFFVSGDFRKFFEFLLPWNADTGLYPPAPSLRSWLRRVPQRLDPPVADCPAAPACNLAAADSDCGQVPWGALLSGLGIRTFRSHSQILYHSTELFVCCHPLLDLIGLFVAHGRHITIKPFII